VTLFGMAAGMERGTLRFNVGPADQTGWGGFAGPGIEGGVDVSVVRIDEMVPVDQPITLLKIDIEGADSWALLGCRRLLDKKLVQEIWFEQNKPKMRELGIDFNLATDFLESVGYKATPQTDAALGCVEWRAVPA
jgi:hypothetical protein